MQSVYSDMKILSQQLVVAAGVKVSISADVWRLQLNALHHQSVGADSMVDCVAGMATSSIAVGHTLRPQA